MTKLEAQILKSQILKSQIRVAKLKQKQREQEAKRKAKLKPKNPKKRGRPRIDERLIIKAIKMAETKFLPDVALSLGISLKTLTNYGVTRRALNARAKLEADKGNEK